MIAILHDHRFLMTMTSLPSAKLMKPLIQILYDHRLNPGISNEASQLVRQIKMRLI